MDEQTLRVIKVLILHLGLPEAMAAFSAVCSELSLELKPEHAGEAKILMSVSSSLDRICARVERDYIRTMILPG